MTPQMMAHLVFLLSDNRPIELPILNGFLILYRAEVFRTVGLMDDVLSPRGYGEENDFAFKMRQHNYSLWVAPNSYVFHHKGKSYQKEEQGKLGRETYARLIERYGLQIGQAETAMRDNRFLGAIRSSLQHNLLQSLPSLQYGMSVLMILNVMNTRKLFMLRGGWISVVQEGLGLWKHGVYSRVAVPAGYLEDFYLAFPEARTANLFIGFTGNSPEALAAEIVAHGQVFDFVVATHCSTVFTIRKITEKWPNAIPSYYVQDIETDFTDERVKASALSNYTNFSDGFVFTKTSWLKEELRKQFNLTSHLISPTVDTDFFTPGKQNYKEQMQLCAMVRIATPRRGPKRILEVLSWAAETLGANSTAFGSSKDEIVSLLNDEEKKTLKLPLINILGPLDRQRMLHAYQACEIFLDLSSWQAFGRSGIEAMASGVVPVLPQRGGASTYAKSMVNAFLINTSSTREAKLLLQDIALGKYNMKKMRDAALATSAEFSIQNVTRKTYRTFRTFLHEWQDIRVSASI
jgi:glycosyltransferase involved in cell wall biosynthesis